MLRVRNGITFLALNGAKIQVLVDGDNFYMPPALPPVTEGPIALHIEATPPPPNDYFKDAATIAGRTSEEPDGARFHFADVFGYNWNATKETGEPKHAGDQGGASVWYAWTAPESGLARVSLCCGAADLLGVYTGNAVNALTEVESGKGSVEVPVTAGTTYRIAVDSEFSFFLGGTFDDSFNLMVAMNLAPGKPLSDGGSAGSSTGPVPVDGIAPETTILKRKVRSKARSATFSFGAGEAGATFRCKLDGRKAVPCKSPKSYAGLAPGPHTFKVYAVDASGNADPTPAKASFSIARPRRGQN
jgi:hypothetical protein